MDQSNPSVTHSKMSALGGWIFGLEYGVPITGCVSLLNQQQRSDSHFDFIYLGEVARQLFCPLYNLLFHGHASFPPLSTNPVPLCE